MKRAIVIFAITTISAGCATVESPILENSAWDQANSADPQKSRFNGKPCVIDPKRQALESVAMTYSALTIKASEEYAKLTNDANKTRLDAAMTNMDNAWRSVDSLNNSNNRKIVDELCQAYSYADFYRQRYIQLSGEAYTAGTWIDTLGLLTGMWTASAIGFDMHSDALLTSTLTMASLMGVKSYTQPRQRANLYLQGADRMQCIIATSSKIIGQSVDSKFLHFMTLSNQLESALKTLDGFTPTDLGKAQTFVKTMSGQNKINAETVLNSFYELRANSSETRTHLEEGLSLISGMPNEITNSVKDAELSFNRSFVTSAPNFKESLGYIQQALAENAASQTKSAAFGAAVDTSATPSVDLTDAVAFVKTDTDNGSAEFLDLYTALSSLLIAHDKIASQLVNYSSVKAALTLCKAV